MKRLMVFILLMISCSQGSPQVVYILGANLVEGGALVQIEKCTEAPDGQPLGCEPFVFQKLEPPDTTLLNVRMQCP